MTVIIFMIIMIPIIEKSSRMPVINLDVPDDLPEPGTDRPRVSAFPLGRDEFAALRNG